MYNLKWKPTIAVLSLVAIVGVFQNCAKAPYIAQEDLASNSGQNRSDDESGINIKSFSPASATLAGAVTFVIYGERFQPDDVVTVGGVNCPSVVWVSASELNCQLPPSTSAKMASVVVTRADGTSTDHAENFEYALTVNPHVPCSINSTHKQTANFTFAFASLEAGTCNWGRSGNLAAGAGGARARREQVVGFTLPSNAVICDAAVNFRDTDIVFRDTILLSLNNRVMASSHRNLPLGLNRDSNGYYIYDWSRVAGRAVGTGPHCADADSVCTIAALAAAGHSSVTFRPSVAFISAALSVVTNGQHQMRLTTTGDDDANDCRHNGLSGTASITYDQP